MNQNLLLDRDDDAITLFEIKYTQKSFLIDKQYANILKQKIEVFKERTGTSKQIFLVFISANGIKSNSYSQSMISKVIDISGLFDER